MIERPIEDEPPIGEVEAPAEPQPKKRRSRAKAKTEEAAETSAEPAPPEAPPAETSEDAKPAKPARKSRAKKAKDEAPAPVEGGPAVPTADNDEADDASGEGPRRGWWQRTFG